MDASGGTHWRRLPIRRSAFIMDLTIKQEQQTEIASLTGALSNRIKPLTAACVLCSQKGVRLETRPAVSGEFDMTATYAKS